MNLSYQQALWAAYTILEVLYDEEVNSKLSFILSDMFPFGFNDKVCADPALWQSWLECSKKINDTGLLTFEQVMPTLIDFLKINESEYSCFKEDGGDYSTCDIIESVTHYVTNGYWEMLLNKVLTHGKNDILP